MSGNGKILTMEGKAKRDVQGRLLSRSATIGEVYQIVAEETAKVHEFYMNQIPPYVARMIQDALVSYGLVVIPGAPGETVPVEGCASPTSEVPKAQA